MSMNSNPPKSKSSVSNLILFGIIAVIAICIGGLLIFRLLLNSSNSAAKVLSAHDTLEVSAIDVVKDSGYTVTSAVCEVVSSERYKPSVNIDGGQIVFHAFRITKPSLGSEVVVLFYSNHTAAQGRGLIFTVNSEAARLFPDYPDASRSSKYPINVETAGAQDALECAQQAEKAPF